MRQKVIMMSMVMTDYELLSYADNTKLPFNAYSISQGSIQNLFI